MCRSVRYRPWTHCRSIVWIFDHDHFVLEVDSKATDKDSFLLVDLDQLAGSTEINCILDVFNDL